MLLIHQQKGPIEGSFCVRGPTGEFKLMKVEEFLALAPATLEADESGPATLKIVVNYSGLKACTYMRTDHSENFPTQGASWEEVLVRLDAQLRNKGVLKTTLLRDLN